MAKKKNPNQKTVSQKQKSVLKTHDEKTTLHPHASSSTLSYLQHPS